MSDPREVIATELARIAIAPLSHKADSIIYALIVAGYVIEPAWRPIKTAPKDGTHILVCNADNSYTPPTVAHWFEDGFYTSVNENAPQYPYPATHYKPTLVDLPYVK